jgi:3-oxoacyl-[acyl-carrier protein] reductase
VAAALAGKSALVSGGAGGIGWAIALAFAAAGAAVIAVDTDEAGAAETARLVVDAGGSALARACDVAVEGDTRSAAAAAYDAFGGSTFW